MSEDFVLTDADTRKLFRAPSRAMNCRQMIWSAAKEKSPLVLSEFVRDHKEEFHSAEIYQAAYVLVTHGILTRSDISWTVVEKGQERIRYRQAVKFVEPFTNASRKW